MLLRDWNSFFCSLPNSSGAAPSPFLGQVRATLCLPQLLYQAQQVSGLPLVSQVESHTHRNCPWGIFCLVTGAHLDASAG